MSWLGKSGQGVVVCLGIGLLALSGGACYEGGGGPSGDVRDPTPWAYSTSYVSVRVDETTTVDTQESSGAARVVLLAVTLANPHERAVKLAGLRVRGDGDLESLETVRIALDLDRNGVITKKDSKVWSGPFSGNVIDSSDWVTTMEPWSTLSIIVDGDIAPGAPAGSSFRVWIDSDAGDIAFKGLPPGGGPLGRAGSGWRTVGATPSATLGQELPDIRFPVGPGETSIPALAARIRVSSVESVESFRVALEGSGSASAWSRVTWDLWIDENADGKATDGQDRLVAGDLRIDPQGSPTVVDVPEPVPAGTAVNLVVTGSVGSDVPLDDGLFSIGLTLEEATGVVSGSGFTLGGEPVQGGVRLGGRDLVVAVGGEITVLDPDLRVTLAMPEEPDNTEAILTIDPHWRWAATATPPPQRTFRDPLVMVDLRDGTVASIVPLDGVIQTLVAHPSGERLYMGVDDWMPTIREVFIPEDLSQTWISPVQEPWMFASASFIFDIDATASIAYVYEQGMGRESIRVYDTATSAEIRTLEGGDGITHMDVAPDGSRIVARRVSGLHLTDQYLRTIPVDGSPWGEVKIDVPGGAPFEFSLSANGAEVYVSVDDQVRIFDPVTLVAVDTVSFPGEVLSISGGNSPDRLVVLTEDRDLYIVDSGQLPRLATAGIGHGACTIGVAR